jgi:hypothetical protein
LVEIEQRCCSFLSWTVADSGDELTLSISGAPADLDSVAGLALKPNA